MTETSKKVVMAALVDTMLSDLLVTASRTFTLASLLLTAAWCSYNDSQFLGFPKWKLNLESWHGVLMIAGLFFALIYAVTTFSEYTKMLEQQANTRYERIKILIWNLVGLTSGVFGITAIVQWKNSKSESHLASLHSWIGLVSLASALYYLATEVLKAYFRGMGKNKAAAAFVEFHQQTLVLLAITSTAVASVTGIMDHFSLSGGCDYLNTKRLASLSIGCKIGNGIGLCVFFASVLAIMAVGLHSVINYVQLKFTAYDISFKPKIMEGAPADAAVDSAGTKHVPVHVVDQSNANASENDKGGKSE
jgi:hypothetical protein